jgi:Arginine methyltransferase-interacting protein, contains RING Zn-finger
MSLASGPASAGGQEPGRSPLTRGAEVTNPIEGVKNFMKNLQRYLKEMERLIIENVNTKIELKTVIRKTIQEVDRVKDAEHFENLLNQAMRNTVPDPPVATNVCKKCGEDFKKEEQLLNQIRAGIEKVYGGDEADLETLLKIEWPNAAYELVKEVGGNPVEVCTKNHLVLWMGSNPQENTSLISIARKKFPDVDGTLKDGKVINNFQVLEVLSRVRGDAKRAIQTTCYVVNGEVREAVKQMRIIMEETKQTGNLAVDFATVDSVNYKTVRKQMEIAFYKSGMDVTLFIPPGKIRRGATRKQEGSNSDVITICSDTISYSDMAKKVREVVNPENMLKMGVVVKGTKKGARDNEIRIITETGGGAEKLKREILEKTGGIQAKVTENKRPVLISNLDLITSEDEVKTAIFNELKGKGINLQEEKVEVKNLRVNRRGTQSAEVWLPVEASTILHDMGKVKIGWSVCAVRMKVRIDRCYNCLKIGHLGQSCRAPRNQEKKCLKCTQIGHVVMDCKNVSYCNECKQSGHRADSMFCPKFRKMVYKN